MVEIKEQIERFRDADPAEPSDNYQWLQEAADTIERLAFTIDDLKVENRKLRAVVVAAENLVTDEEMPADAGDDWAEWMELEEALAALEEKD